MADVLGYNLSNYDLVKYDKAPKMVVNKWNDGSLSLAPEYEKDQMFYSSVASTDDSPYLDRNDLEGMAEDFNNDPDLEEEYKDSRYKAVNDLIEYNTNCIKDKEKELHNLKELKLKLNEER